MSQERATLFESSAVHSFVCAEVSQRGCAKLLKSSTMFSTVRILSWSDNWLES